MCFILLLQAYGLKLVKASNETASAGNSTLTKVLTLPDGTIERHYANGTVNRDYSVTSQLQISTTWTVTTATTTIIVWPSLPDKPPSLIEPIFRLMCVIGAAFMLYEARKSYKSLGPKPVERPFPKLPFSIKIKHNEKNSIVIEISSAGFPLRPCV